MVYFSHASQESPIWSFIKRENLVIEDASACGHDPRMGTQCVVRMPPEMSPERIGDRLRVVREAFGLRKSEIADMLGIERTYWSRFENGNRPITNEVAYLLVERFGVTLDYLILNRWEGLPLAVAERLRSVIRAKT